MNQLQISQFGPYLGSFLLHSYGYEAVNEPKSGLKHSDFRYGPESQTGCKRFPALHADFELARKLACGSDILVQIPQNLYFVSAASHGRELRERF